jgi:hypothetical protein
MHDREDDGLPPLPPPEPAKPSLRGQRHGITRARDAKRAAETVYDAVIASQGVVRMPAP